MNDTDFTSCKFIKDNMQFYTYYDFCDNCNVIKRLYNQMQDNAKIFYKWYVYANIHMAVNFKDAIWNFLNCDDEAYYCHLIELKKRYTLK